MRFRRGASRFISAAVAGILAVSAGVAVATVYRFGGVAVGTEPGDHAQGRFVVSRGSGDARCADPSAATCAARAAVALGGDAQGGALAVSRNGSAVDAGYVAIGTGNAYGSTSCTPTPYRLDCYYGAAPIAVAWNGNARGSLVAVSVKRDATGGSVCSYYSYGDPSCYVNTSLLAFSWAGWAVGTVAVSGTGRAGHTFHWCQTKPSTLIAVAGTGPADGLVSVSGTGDAEGTETYCEDRGGGTHQSGHALVAVTGTGTARGTIAVSALGDTEGWYEPDGNGSGQDQDPALAVSPGGVCIGQVTATSCVP